MPSRLTLLVCLTAVACAFMLGLGLQALAAPAQSKRAADLSRRVASLEHQMALQRKINLGQNRINSLVTNQLASLATQSPSLSTSVQVAFGTTDSNGGAPATAFCPGGQKALGGGGGFVGQAYYSDHLLWSYADIPDSSWTASATGPVSGRTFEVYAVCGSVG